jgi:hypothetical protein
LKTLNEKLNNCGKDYKKTNSTLVILVEKKMPSSFDMFIQTRHRAIEMSKGYMTPRFEYFFKGLINEQERLIASGQFNSNKALMTHNKNNPNKFFNKNPKSHTKGSSQHSSNDACDDASKKKQFNRCKYCGKTNQPENIFFK